MRNLRMLHLLGLLIITVIPAQVLYGKEPSPEKAMPHLNSVSEYEEKAREIDALIVDHRQLKKDYKEKFFINPELTPLEKLQKIETHCDAVIKAAEDEKSALLAIAHLHQNSADDV